MRVVSVVGARPQFVKRSPVYAALTAAGNEHLIVHTGQHYDHNMSGALFTDLDIPDRTRTSGSAPRRTEHRPAACSSASRRHSWTRLRTRSSCMATRTRRWLPRLPPPSWGEESRLEAGLRSFNRQMPEELNRVATDHLADLLLAPTQGAVAQLGHEGLAERTVFTGDVMTDLCLSVGSNSSAPAGLPNSVDQSQPYFIATIHRPSNTDHPVRVEQILTALGHLPAQVVLVTHPRLRDRSHAAGLTLESHGLHTVEPLGYREMIASVRFSTGVITDSGGLQKEACILGVPCTTLRPETEWNETTSAGLNVVDDKVLHLREHVLRPRPTSGMETHFGDGQAAARAVEAMRTFLAGLACGRMGSEAAAGVVRG